MGYSVCVGHYPYHKERRTCDGCDRCPKCDGFRSVRMYCWRCCGPVYACPDCAKEIAQHIVEQGFPDGRWAESDEIVRGYLRACRVAGNERARLDGLARIAVRAMGIPA